MNEELNYGSRKIVLIVTVRASAITFVYGFAKYVASKGHEVTIIASGLEEDSIPVGKGTLTTTSLAMERNPHPIKDLVSLIRMIQKLRRLSPDIVAYGTPKASLLGSIASLLVGVPARIYQLWGLRLETVQGFQRQILLAMEWLTGRLSTRILANSESLAERYTQLRLNSNKFVDVIGKGSSHGVDLVKFSRLAEMAELDEKTSEFIRVRSGNHVVGFIGRLHEDKGIDTLIGAVRMLRKQGISITLLLLGNDEGANLELTPEQDNDTILVGHVSDIRPYLSSMDILVLPSLREGFPNVVLEAAAMEIPAVVSNGTGVIDSVVDGETGIIAEVKNTVDFANAIRELVGNDQFRKKLGIQARRRVEDHFEQRSIWSQTLLYMLSKS